MFCQHDAGNIERFLRFFKAKREQHLEHLTAEFESTVADRLREDLLTRDDAMELLGDLQRAVRAHVDDELRRTVNMNVLLLKQILDQAEQHEVVVQMDFGQIESHVLLEQVEKLGIDELTRAAHRETKLKTEAVSLKAEYAKLERENNTLRQELAAARSNSAGAGAGEVSSEGGSGVGNTSPNANAHRAEAKASRSSVSHGDAALSAAPAKGLGGLAPLPTLPTLPLGAKAGLDGSIHPTALAEELQRARAREAQLVAEAKQAEGRVTQTKQFQQLKRMLAEKNSELVELRRKLQKYEGDGCKLVDDD